FVVEDMQYQYDLQGEKLTKLGKAPPAPPAFGGPGGQFGFRRRQEEQQQEQRRDQQQEQRQEQQQQQQQQEQQQQDQQRRGQRGGFPPGMAARQSQDGRVFSPDRKAYIFVRDHNLYLLDATDKPLDSLILPIGRPDFAGTLANAWVAAKGQT